MERRSTMPFAKKRRGKRGRFDYPFLLPGRGSPLPELRRRGDGPGSRDSSGIDRIASRLESQEAEIRKAGKLSLRALHLMEDFLDREGRPGGNVPDSAVPVELLEVFESFHRLVTRSGDDEAAGGDDEPNAFLEGLEIIHAKFLDYLKAGGIELIPAEGRIFDPGRHRALRVVEVEEGEDGLIIEEIAPGYQSGGKALKCSEVVVQRMANPSSDSPAAGGERNGSPE